MTNNVKTLANKGGNAFPVELPVSKCTDDQRMGNIVLETNTTIYELYGKKHLTANTPIKADLSNMNPNNIILAPN